MQLHGVHAMPSQVLSTRCLHLTAPRRQSDHRSQCRVVALDPSIVGAAATLAFLPWNGCSQGGFYATGVDGVPGKDCQVMYQPAAAAEARLVERLRAAGSGAGAPALSSASQRLPPSQQDDATLSRAADTTTQLAQQPQAADPQPEPPAAPVAGGAQTAAPELTDTQLAAAKDLARQILLEEEQQRTRELVDSAWQSLE